MNDLNTSGMVHTPDDIARAHAAVIEQMERSTVDLAPCVHAVEVLERLPLPEGPVDDRAALAFEVARYMGFEDNKELSARALRAAASDRAEFADPAVRRRWLTALGLVAVGHGRAGDAIRHFSEALELATHLSDRLGISAICTNLALLSAGAGQYEDVVQFTSTAIDHMEQHASRSESLPRFNSFASAYLNRSNALLRLGRIDGGVSDAAQVVALLDDSVAPASRELRVKGLFMLASLRIERGEFGHARYLLTLIDQALSTMVDSGHDELVLSADIVRGQLLASSGPSSQGLELIESVLTRCAARRSSAYDDVATDALYALQRTARACGLDAKADEALTLFSNRLHANAERMVTGFSKVAGPAIKKELSAARSEVDGIVRGIARTAPRPDGSPAQDWGNLLAMAASSSATEERSGEHGVRVASLARHVASALDIGRGDALILERAALLHDIGKAGVPSSVLMSSGPLSEHQSALLVRHAEDGGRLIECSVLPDRGRIAEIVRLHHCPFDGVGSSHAAKGENIPLEARIIAACDFFDALITGRPRRPAIPIALALGEVLRMAGRDLDPRVSEVLIETVRRLQREHVDLIGYLAQDADRHDFTSALRRLRKAAEVANKGSTWQAQVP